MRPGQSDLVVGNQSPAGALELMVFKILSNIGHPDSVILHALSVDLFQ